MNLQELKTEFLKRFPGGADEIRFFTAPSCVNLLGGYTHNGGAFSATVALSMGTIIAVRKRGDRKLCMQSTERDIQIEADLDLPEEYKGLEWGEYQLGIAGELMKHGYRLVGADMLYYDTIPENSGISHTASVGIATAVSMASLSGVISVDRVEMAKIARRAQIHYMKTDSGIIDYFTAAMGKENNAVLLNCKNLDYRLSELDMRGYKLIIADTNKKKAANKYSDIMDKAADIGFERLKKEIPSATCLADVASAELMACTDLIADKTVRLCTEHIVIENEKVLRMRECIDNADIKGVGHLMSLMHEDLLENSDIICEEIRVLIKEALGTDGVCGTRIAGDTCTVSLVRNEAVDAFVERVGAGYTEKIGYAPSFYVTDTSDGARELFLE